MFNPTELLIAECIRQIQEGYHRTFGGMKKDYQDIIGWAAGMALEIISTSDALYHNVSHTILVTLVGQEIMRGWQIRHGGVTCEDWLHFMISLVCHDIGYVKGLCSRDTGKVFATGKGEETLPIPVGSTDASLTPYHVDRGKMFISERFKGHTLIDADIIRANIELTRFPVPQSSDPKAVKSYPGFVRAADLIGQLSDPQYLKKIAALFYEFEETGLNKKLDYKNPADLRCGYPKFYWSNVFPFIQEALQMLSLTQQGQQIRSSLYANVFMVEHNCEDVGQA